MKGSTYFCSSLNTAQASKRCYGTLSFGFQVDGWRTPLTKTVGTDKFHLSYRWGEIAFETQDSYQYIPSRRAYP